MCSLFEAYHLRSDVTWNIPVNNMPSSENSCGETPISRSAAVRNGTCSPVGLCLSIRAHSQGAFRRNMVGVGKKTATAKAERSSSNDGGFGAARTRCRREEDPGCGKQAEEGGRALPAVPAPATGGDSALRRPQEANQELGDMTLSSCYEPHARHPMDDFDDLLQAFDGFIDGSENVSGIVDRGQPRKHNQGTKRGAGMAAVDPFVRHPDPRATPDEERGRLPRLHRRSSGASVDPSWLQTELERPRTHAKGRRTSHTQPIKSLSQLSHKHSQPLGWERKLHDLQYDDPLELMLRSKVNRRPDLEGLDFRHGNTIRPSQKDLDTCSGEAGTAIDFVYSTATAGVFRLTHTSTGFVHYGYSWDIAGAKADQLRRLRMAFSDGVNCNNSSAPHRHRGLSAVVRREQEQPWCIDRLESGGARDNNLQAVSNDEVQQLRFEVVRRVPLPTRFRASDFEERMRQACEQELLSRRAHLLVLAARQYRRNTVGPAFKRMLVACRSEGDEEKCAAAAEVQRVWRGFCVRDSSRCTREIECGDRLTIERARIRAILAAWGQTTHRANMGRRRARGLRNEREQAATRRKQASATAAATIQDWVKCSYKRRKKAQAAADKAAVEALLRAIRLAEEAKELPPKGATLGGPKSPINTHETRVASGPYDVHTHASLAGAPDWSSATPSGSSSRGQQRRRPSSSRERRLKLITHSRVDDVDAPKEVQHPPSQQQRRDKRPSSAPRSNRVAATCRRPRDSVPAATPAGLVTALIPDASRLVLEGDPCFTAATAIQAAWRGFTARLGIRKRRRAAVALRRKREGKWRQQRGVVGKRVSVAWDERRGLEEGGGREDGGAGVASCTEIQVALR